MLYAFLRLLIQASLVVCLAGCLSDNVEFEPHKGKSHRVIFTIDPLPANGGGLLLWGRSDTGDSFGQVVSGNTVTVDMHSGNWTYYGMAWAGEAGDENGNTVVGDSVASIPLTVIILHLHRQRWSPERHSITGLARSR